MKIKTLNLFKISSLLLIAIFTFSCNRNKTPDNYFKIDDSVHEIKSGCIINNGEVEDGFNVELRLYDETKTNFINFAFISDQAERIASSTYHINNNGAWSKSDVLTKITSGVVVINRSSDGYTIDIRCTDEYSNEIKGYFKGNLSLQDEDNLVHKLPDYVLPDAVYDAVTQYIPIHSGLTPPDMTGEYVSSPHILIYESYGEKPDSIQRYSDLYFGFMYINKQMNLYKRQFDVEKGKNVEEVHYNLKLTGNNDYFTCYYVMDSYVQGYYSQQSFIFSGKKTANGLEDFHTAVVLLETSGNPNMYEKNSYRILKDEDGLAESRNWLSGSRGSMTNLSQSGNPFDIWMK